MYNLKDSINQFSDYICREILAIGIDWVSQIEGDEGVDVEINDQKLTILVRQKGQ